MGISVQQWRSTIGSFYQDSFKIITKKHKSSSTDVPRSGLMILTMIIFSAALVCSTCIAPPPFPPTSWSPQAPRSPNTWPPPWQSSWHVSTRISPAFTLSIEPLYTWRPPWQTFWHSSTRTSPTTPSREPPSIWRPPCQLSWLSLTRSSPSTSTFSGATQESSPCPVLNCLAEALFKTVTNFQARYTNGNRRSRGIKICHWNKGGSFLINKMPEIKNLISQHHPHILGVSEANLLDVHDADLAAVQDYKLHTCPTMSNPSLKVSRIVVYTHKDLVAKLRPDLMCDRYSSIWLEVGLPHHKKFLVSQSYREWQYTNQRGDRSSSTIPEQLTRWLLFLDQWERALATGMEVHCLGDMNLNHCNWAESNLPRSNQTYKLKDLISALFTRILTQGVSQQVSGPTRHFPGQVSTGLDHYFTNQPAKLSQVQKHDDQWSEIIQVY